MGRNSLELAEDTKAVIEFLKGLPSPPLEGVWEQVELLRELVHGLHACQPRCDWTIQSTSLRRVFDAAVEKKTDAAVGALLAFLLVWQRVVQKQVYDRTWRPASSVLLLTASALAFAAIWVWVCLDARGISLRLLLAIEMVLGVISGNVMCLHLPGGRVQRGLLAMGVVQPILFLAFCVCLILVGGYVTGTAWRLAAVYLGYFVAGMLCVVAFRKLGGLLFSLKKRKRQLSE